MLFGAIRSDPNENANRPHYPYLEIIDPTDPTHATTLQLDASVVKHMSVYSSVDISVGGGAGHEEGFITGGGGMPFVPDTSRGIITADVYLYHRDSEAESQDGPWFESHVFILDSEDMLAKIPSPSNAERSYIEWKDLSLSTGIFSYSAVGNDRYRIFSRHSYVVGFFYASPVQPLVPEDPEGPRCFFVYDFNPYRETSDALPGGDPDPKPRYSQHTSEITREVVGGFSCWRMRFDLPPAEESLRKCHIALTDGGVVLFEVCLMVFSSGL